MSPWSLESHPTTTTTRELGQGSKGKHSSDSFAPRVEGKARPEKTFIFPMIHDRYAEQYGMPAQGHRSVDCMSSDYTSAKDQKNAPELDELVLVGLVRPGLAAAAAGDHQRWFHPCHRWPSAPSRHRRLRNGQMPMLS